EQLSAGLTPGRMDVRELLLDHRLSPQVRVEAEVAHRRALGPGRPPAALLAQRGEARAGRGARVAEHGHVTVVIVLRGPAQARGVFVERLAQRLLEQGP